MNNLQDFPSFINYFRQLQAEKKGLNSFVHGGINRMASLDRSTTTYPVLWLETPSFTPSENGADNVTGTWSAAIVVLDHTGDMDYAEEDQAWADTLKMLNSLLSRIKRDNRGFALSKRAVEPVSPMFVTDLVGWRYEFEIEDYLDLCYKPEEWEGAE
ncbi:hypothetical protein [Pontibacter mangrovi]|uniref:Uncharacterized protein n=1 Tax=Pontibacter mangrovi TaxID=2589816 RepID=A0A501W3U7_9BACT|nr:hypothetical protein [Pontibacter mangrovi]TPE43958.1 hypothetical protein FJM65_11070 [Pontibacter mangrovi]